MKIDIHNTIISWLISGKLLDSLNKVANRIAEGNKSIKKVQMYGDFFAYNDSTTFAEYVFKDQEKIYYPLTLIYKNNKWEY